MKWRYKLPIKPKDGFDIEDSDGRVMCGVVLAVRQGVITVVFNLCDLKEDHLLHSKENPSEGIVLDTNHVSGYECREEP